MASDHPTVPTDFGILGHARISDSIWGVYQGNPQLLLKMPSPNEAPAPEYARVKGNNFWSPTYISPRYPYVMFIPACFPWYGPIFGKLNYRRDKLPLVKQEDGRWRLEVPVTEEWSKLEGSLRRVAIRMMTLTKTPYPEEMVQFALPYRFGYLRPYRTENAARTVVCRSLHAFLPLIGNLAMLFWFIQMESKDMPDWDGRKILCEQAGVHPQWLADLERSVVGTSTYPDSRPEIFVPYSLRELRFVPDMLEINYLSRLPGKVAFSRWIRTECAENTRPVHRVDVCDTVEPVESISPVEANSQQRSGETMAEFFARRAKSNANRAAHESPDDAKRRQQQEEHAAKGGVPGRKGARVYVWEKSHGHYIRRAAGRDNYEDVWDEYGPLQRRFDGFHNEWDVCEAFGPEGGGDEDDDDFDDLDIEPGFTGAGDEGDDDDAPSQLLPEDDLEEGQLPPTVPSHQAVFDSRSIEDYASIAASFDDIIYLRFGCTAPTEKLDVPADLMLPSSDITKKFLGGGTLPAVNEKQFDNFRLFLAHCKKAHNLDSIPRNLLDYHDLDADIFTRWTIQLRRETLNDKLYYVLHEDGSKVLLYLLLSSATTALEIVRQQWGPSLRVIMEKLLSRGHEFNVCFRSDEARVGRPRARNLYSGLGHRPLAYRPDAHDYRSYVAIRDQFLITPRGRAALQYGGIIGRLARAVVSVDNVFAYWDDCLTEQEIDLICGVYHISTGQVDPGSSSGEQTTTRSWWPRPASTASSGMSVGWWTPMWEAWFQKRLALLEQDPPAGDLVTHAKWKHNLKLERRCPDYVQATERCAAQILSVLRP
ncbi:hypothetical protein DFH06DRAFT_1128077 [Mycena polygramma]|nr:hypothetical protein DFH06DRAFT_1128077 [Mycena polygramma]